METRFARPSSSYTRRRSSIVQDKSFTSRCSVESTALDTASLQIKILPRGSREGEQELEMLMLDG